MVHSIRVAAQAYSKANDSLAKRGNAKPAKAWRILAGSYLPDGVVCLC